MFNFEYFFDTPYSFEDFFRNLKGGNDREMTITVSDSLPKRSLRGQKRLEELKSQAEDAKYIEI